ncbi:putative quinone oxidoreductase [Choanephora cucurbitarum]|nr:putative quinone oxidoreductase [Choanephora cucurbitarum]
MLLGHCVGVLTIPGMTACFGLNEIIAKTLGLYVVGSAGNDEKVEYLKSIGFDDVFNYKNGKIEELLRKHCPNGINIYFEVIGDKMLDMVFRVANNFARIIACGMISQYNLSKPQFIYNTVMIVTKRIKFNGFIIMDHLDFEEKFLNDVTPLLVDGKVKYREDIVNGIDNAPQALVNVLKGKNFCKMVARIADL